MAWIVEVIFPNSETPHYLKSPQPAVFSPMRDEAFQCGREQDAQALARLTNPRGEVRLVDLDERPGR